MSKMYGYILLITLLACNKYFMVDKKDVVITKDGCILLMSNEYYFVKKKFRNDEALISFIQKPDAVLYQLPFRMQGQVNEVLTPSKFKKLQRPFVPELSSMNTNSEVRYMNTKIKLIYSRPWADDKFRTLNIRDYDHVENEYNVKYKVEGRTLYLVIPDKQGLVER